MENITSKFYNCIVCNDNNWHQLPKSHLNRSVRSDGYILLQSMQKAQCNKCGLVQISHLPDAKKLQELYKDNYNIYDLRPESEKFITGRYKALSQAITNSLAPYKPKTVLEIGCGNGSALQAVQSIWQEAQCIGMEPVTTAVKIAQENNICVYQGMVGGQISEEITKYKYDVIYSIHVIEHTEDPVTFLNNIKSLLKPSGYIIITCPNARTPNLEIMRTDHNFSMTPYHLEEIAKKANLIPLRNTLCPGGGEDLDYEHNQLLVCIPKKDNTKISKFNNLPDYLNDVARKKLFDARKKYFDDFDSLDIKIQNRMDHNKKWYCFGSGGWACMLAGYAPNVWKNIEGCVIDGGSEQMFYGKQIFSYEKIKYNDNIGFIIGTNPAIQQLIEKRLKDEGIDSVICWNDIISV